MKRLCSSILAPLLLVATTATPAAEPKTPSIEDLWKIIQQQQGRQEGGGRR
jgi:hypothetical protein